MVDWQDMQTLVIDTNGIVKKLEQRGFSRTQAEGIRDAEAAVPAAAGGARVCCRLPEARRLLRRAALIVA
jgi:hypothetical protein